VTDSEPAATKTTPPVPLPVSSLRWVLGISWVAFQVWIMFDPQQPMVLRPIHVGLAVALAILWRPLRLAVPRLGGVIDAVLLVGTSATVVYYVIESERLVARMAAIDPILTGDLIFGVVIVVVLLECVRRVVGWTLLGVILLFLVYAFIGRWWYGWVDVPWIPELLKFSGFRFPEAIESFTMKTEGIFGIPTSTSLNFVFYFVLFGAVYSAIGGGQFFIDLGLRAAGGRNAGAAKAAIISSGLMGSISGSAVANVATTGLFTIPLMRRTGYSPTFAAGVEAMASTGGQLMPPVMGVAAFVMTELLQTPYGTIALAGVLPAITFYFSLLLLVDLHSRRTGQGTTKPGELKPNPLLRRLYLLIPPVALVSLLVAGFSAGRSALYAAAICIPTCYLHKATRLGPRQWLLAIANGTRQAAEVTVPIAAIGIIIEVCVQSNLTLEFTAELAGLSDGSLPGALVLVVFACIVMGMGLPTVAAYIIGATLFVPALIGLGVGQLPAHFFVMYYCVLSMVTPPVALASYTAAGLAGADSVVTSLRAFRLSLVAFFVPFAFVFEPALLGEGTWWAIGLSALVLAAGVTCWAGALAGYLFGALGTFARGLLGVLGLAVIFSPVLAWQGSSGEVDDRIRLGVGLGGIVLVGIVLGMFRARAKRAT